MFYECSSLKELNLSNFNTNNVTDMSGMFRGCLDELKLKIKSQFKNIKEEIKNNNDENFNLKADYLIKVDDSKGNFSFYESS